MLLPTEDKRGLNAKIVNQPEFFQEPDCAYQIGYVFIDGKKHPAKVDKDGKVYVLPDDAEIQTEFAAYFWNRNRCIWES